MIDQSAPCVLVVEDDPGMRVMVCHGGDAGFWVPRKPDGVIGPLRAALAE